MFDCAVCSLCTTLPVEWEPDLIAISLLYLSCRLTKFKVDSWVDKPQGYTGKWYEFFVSDVNLDIIESKLLAACGLGLHFFFMGLLKVTVRHNFLWSYFFDLGSVVPTCMALLVLQHWINFDQIPVRIAPV